MEEIKLDVQLRKEIGRRKIKDVRFEDAVPAVVYGGGQPATNIKVDRRSYEKIMRQHRGESVLFHLNVLEGENKAKDYSVIVKEEQHHPVKDSLLHIDFKRVSLTEEIEVKVALVAKGEAPGVKNEGGSLDHALWELDIICFPTKIPANISVDISQLNIGDAVHVKDLPLPEGVRTKHEGDAIVFSVVPPMKEEGEEETEEEKEEESDLEPEVIKEKKGKQEASEESEKKASE